MALEVLLFPHVNKYQNILPACYPIYTKVPLATSTGQIALLFPEIQAQDSHPLPLVGGSMTIMMGYEIILLAFLMES